WDFCYSKSKVVKGRFVGGGDGEMGRWGDGEDERTFLVCVISVNTLSPPYPYLTNKSVKSVF
ncbi:MAG: hypothetical protein RLP02_02545, partial [Coleofasciculus sp. C2-GNP5-27]